jgi:hypothetical protein
MIRIASRCSGKYLRSNLRGAASKQNGGSGDNVQSD